MSTTDAADPAATEALYEALARAIDTARENPDPAEAERLFLTKLAFAALRELPENRHTALIALCLKDLARPDE